MNERVQTDPNPAKEFFIARQPILNRKNNIFAYELLFRSANHASSGVTDDLQATSAVISHVVELGLPRVIGTELGFINVDAQMIMSDFVRFLPPKNVVLEILETVQITPALTARIAELSAAGYTFALDDVVENLASFAPVLPLISIIKIDITGMPSAKLRNIASQFSRIKKKLLAEKVETAEQLQLCMDCGFDYFQGYYFSRPHIISGKKMSASQTTIIQLLKQLDADASASEIERTVKHDPALIVGLLKIVNTPAAGVGFKITSLKQALVTIGNRQLRRWLQILLFANSSGSSTAVSPLLVQATGRGKLMELLSRAAQPKNSIAAEIAFTVGVMSLLPALFNVTIDTVLEQLQVEEEIARALRTRDNFLGQLLTIAESSENLESSLSLHELLQDMDVTVDEFNYMQISAFEWSRAVAT